ncbi:MAG: ABC transporter permease [bacterium]
MKSRTMIFSLAGLACIVLAACLGPMISPYGYETISDLQFSPPCWQHWLGTDIHGRDVLTRILYGARISLLVGMVGAGVSLVIGVSYGLASGYCGGKVDRAMMRFVDILYSLPRIIIVIALIALLDEAFKNKFQEWPALVQSSRIVILFFALGMVEWLTMARIVRGQTLSLKERAFVHAARVLGQGPLRIMWQHLLPNLAGIILVYLTLTIPAVILEESFLSFLGLGVQAPRSSWGTQLSDGAAFINPIRIYWWLLVGPAGFMAFTLLCLNFLGDCLRDRLDVWRG